MANVANTEGISVGENAGLVGAENEVDVKGGLGPNASLGNTTGIDVTGQNTETGRIGAKNKYEITGGLPADASVGNTAKVKVGNNTGSIGSGNRVNIS